MTDKVVAPGPAVIEQNTSGVVGVLAEALAPIVGVAAANECAPVVAALPNIAIVELPKPAFQEDGTWEWCSGRSRNAVWINDDGLIEDRFGIGQEPEDVRMWAADLLAAAARAAGGQ